MATTGLRRRALLASLPMAGLGFPRALRAAPPADPFADGVTMLVAGPAGGRLDDLSDLITRVFGRNLPPGTVIRRQPTGGPDGVTGANRFDARVAPDGTTLLVLPGEAPLAWLTGDPRAHFDAAQWIPVLAGVTPGIIASRVRAGGLRPGSRLRIAAGSPAGPDLPALLALHLLGVEPVPVFGLADPVAARAALAAHTVDAVFLVGSNVPRQAETLAAADIRPLLSIGQPDGHGQIARDPLFPDVPTLPELMLRLRGTPPNGPMFGAWRAAAAAAQLDFALVLPHLTPADIVSVWRQAGGLAAGTPEMAGLAAEGVRPVIGPAFITGTAAMAPSPAALIELRSWLATRFNWQPA